MSARILFGVLISETHIKLKYRSLNSGVIPVLSNYVFSEICDIVSIKKGELRDLLVISIKCKDIDITLDMISSINMFEQGEKVNLTISKERPEFSERDFCAHGYVVTEKKKKDESYTTIISFFGPLLRISSNESFIEKKGLKIMDHIYFCIKKSTA
ncbi:MAG: DNA-directed RNA polymerase subunit G [Metallosphaera sp.]